MYNKKKYRYRRANLILLVLAVIAAIFAVIYISATASSEQSAINHDGSQVQISVSSMRSEHTSNRYYVYMTYDISNYSGAEICYVSYRCDVYEDSTGSQLGYLTGDVGTPMSSHSSFHLSAGLSTEIETYMERSLLSSSDFFAKLYESGMDGLTYRAYPVSVYFSDGKSWSN